ncbi:MAG: tRNA 2-thiouridine(34) synthase MnmA [Helicobacter sp.]|nr:tRNA 2-thiouridine(34) synthase MnmA [Helicobacter sp.]
MKVAMLMSGGIDSSYSVYLLKQQGYEVKGFYLKLHDKEFKHEIFIRNCQKVAQNLDIEFEVVDARETFKNTVYKYFLESYQRGETPNPCAMCNPLIKFGLALDIALEQGCEFIATGHYARIAEVNGIKRVREARDKKKDQSYFLYAISQKAIDRIIFPLGEMTKEEVKPAAFKAMPWFGTLEEYKESNGICFVETDYIDILKQHLNIHNEGIVRDINGKAVGTHKGYMQYTIGKRKGFNVKGAHDPHFVLSIDAKNNEIIVGKKEDLAKNAILAINKSLPSTFIEDDYHVKIRYLGAYNTARVRLDGDKIIANLQDEVYGVAKGQSLVVYLEDKVLGGGIIL